jgi:hypothetical protein
MKKGTSHNNNFVYIGIIFGLSTGQFRTLKQYWYLRSNKSIYQKIVSELKID